MENDYAVAVLIITEYGRIILVRDRLRPPPHFWKLPGGHSEKDENPWATGTRELVEETGVMETKLQVFIRQERNGHNFYGLKARVDYTPLLKTEGSDGEDISTVSSFSEIRRMKDFLPQHKKVLQEAGFI